MENRPKRLLTLCAAGVGLWLGLRYLLPLSLPFLMGLVLALAAEPMTRFLCRRLRLHRALAAGLSITAAFCLLILLLLTLCALVLRELGALAAVLPDLGQTARSGLNLIQRWLLSLTRQLPQGIGTILERNITGIFSGGSQLLDQGVRYLLGLAGSILAAMPDGALTLGTGVIASFMIAAKLPQLQALASARLPRQRISAALAAVRRVRGALEGWLFAQCKLTTVTWGLVCLGFLVLGIRPAPLWAAAVALVDAFPVLGTGTVLLPWSLICFLQGNSPRAIGLLGVYALVALVRSALEPKLVGKELGLDPLVTLAALYTGYRLFGLGGMLLAPVLAVTAKQSLPLWNRTD